MSSRGSVTSQVLITVESPTSTPPPSVVAGSKRPSTTSLRAPAVTTPTRPSSRQPSCYSTASALAPTGNGLPTSDHGLPTCGKGLPTSGHGLPTCGKGLSTSGHGLPTCGKGLPTSGSKSPGALPACTSTTVLTASQPTRSPLKFAVAGIAMLAGTSALLLSYVLGGSRWTLVGSTAMGVGSLVFVLAICWYLANTPGDQDDERRRCESAVQIHVVDERYLARLIKHRGTSTSHGPSSYLALHATWPGQRLRFVLTILALYKFACMYVCIKY